MPDRSILPPDDSAPPPILLRSRARKRRYEVLDGLGPDGLPYRPRPKRGRFAFLGLSAVLGFVLTACYVTRPDAAAALTAFPAWAWLAPGLILLALGTSRATLRVAACVLVLWLVYAALLPEEPRSLERGTRPWPGDGWYLARRTGGGVRVVSLNCSGGLPEAAAEVTPLRPDVVLLQETPARHDVEMLARQLYGDDAGVAWGVDATIIARGAVTPVPMPGAIGSSATRARVRLATGPEIEVVSLRLMPPLVRADLINPDAWRAQAANRRARRAQVVELAHNLAALPAGVPLVVGGDFNAPGGDAAMRPLLPHARDAFWGGGRGWGNTAMNDFPALRIDQVWASPHFRPGSVTALRTLHSDHRMVLCDLWLNRYPVND